MTNDSKFISKEILMILTMLALTLLIFVFSLSLGSTYISPAAVVKHFLQLDQGEYNFTINILRLPRTLMAFLVGAALSVSGLILQANIKNPLASPDIIGITGGASAGAIIYLSFFSSKFGIAGLPFAAIAGAAVISFLIYLLAWQKGVTSIRLVLIGIGIAAAVDALVTMIIVFSPISTTVQSYVWLTGSIYGTNWDEFYQFLPWVAIFIPLAFAFYKSLNLLALGDKVAASLGLNIQLNRFLLMTISVALAGSAVAYAGGVSFIGLIAPHMARRISGKSYSNLIIISALTGGMIMMAADLIARTAFLPLDLPAGVFVSGIGAPFFIYLLYRNRNNF
ncbi:iron complex transport system permease protein [Halanaerobium saccharolyticum]|uniref:Iron complex transport system permease protein n=1 Tax=Halanaerobium saccharolyticum TaxID=43595 RepID=A0A4R7YSB6_9FIRM|nr:iron ABC transporter permease [Halanaerobium saccharolyticum]RAK06349.1 iron complex transport system permease protein [Halanaerobium saccharolyticum]TDW00661.1 iron complex transport system permease protein [Halanaerobium saccharolyticum]TDX52274.1 iron complex transport system permease protein [Halanaerobium saccharolyticum]